MLIAQFLQRLTLIAFTAHAVLGCCWHHSHAVVDDGCHAHVQQTEIGVDSGCCAHLPDRPSGPATIAACHDDPCHSIESSGAAERRALPILALDECPCGNPHDCVEDSCHYVPRKANSASGFLCISVANLAPTNGVLFALARTPARRVDERVGRLPVESSPQRCANLQSWQI